jgi:hypothetical protein
MNPTPAAEVAAVAVIPPRAALPDTWDPFQLMDRLDEEALRKELEGIASDELVYVVKENGQEVVGLSKVGVDECCMVLVAQGMVIREEELAYEILGDGEQQEALFKVRAARFAVSPTGAEVRLDQVIGVKRQPLYYEPQQLDLDARVPSKKYKGKTYRDLLETADGRDYLAWMAENFKEQEIRTFVQAILAGEAVSAQRGRQLNPHWYEAGAMKAARNARFRLIPADVKAMIIGRARQAGQTRVVERERGQVVSDTTEQLRRQEAERRDRLHTAQTAPQRAQAAAQRDEGDDYDSRGQAAASEPEARSGPYAPTDKQVAFYQRLAESPVFTEEERRRALEWLATRATRQTIKDQIDWLKRQVETRKLRQNGGAE